MLIKNCTLPDYLKGQNSKDYLHDTAAYKHKKFTMKLRNGKSMPCWQWAAEVESWFGMKGVKSMANDISGICMHNVGYPSFEMDIDMARMNKMMEDIMKSAGTFLTSRKKVPAIVPVNTSFFDCGDICIVTWSDGTTTKVRWSGGADEEWNENLAIAIAFIKKFHGLDMYDMLLDSVDKFQKDEEEAAEAKRKAQEEAEELRAKKYRKAVKKAARRQQKREKFERDVRKELDEEFF